MDEEARAAEAQVDVLQGEKNLIEKGTMTSKDAAKR
jgi:hypothetical protein